MADQTHSGSGDNVMGNKYVINNDIDFAKIITAEMKDRDVRIRQLEEWLTDKDKIIAYTEAQLGQFAVELQTLKKDKTFLENRIQELVEEHRNKDLSKTSELYQQAFALLIEGKIDDAIVSLEPGKLEAEFQNIKAHERDAANARQQLAESHVLKAQMLQLEFKFEEAGKNFEKAVLIFPSWATHGKAGAFYYRLEQLDLAESHYRSSIEKAEDESQYAIGLHNLAILYSVQNEFKSAENAYRNALEIQRKLAQNESKVFLYDLAKILNNFGQLLYGLEYHFSDVQPLFEEALGIFKDLDQKTEIAGTLNNLAVLNEKKKEFIVAESAYLEALDIQRKLAQINQQSFLLKVAGTTSNLSVFYKESIPNKERSLAYAREAIRAAQFFLPFMPEAKRHVDRALKAIADWGEDPDTFLRELVQENEGT